ncbi:MAG: type II toxin-antitoxin system VapC family toxin [Cellvibrionales bacterium]|nr:type II toxin-antitoxin system VapC family toxin [Cellvibrionales bacterium]
MQRASVYLETPVISYLTAKPSNDLLKAARHAATIDWWENSRHKFDLYVSALVVDETSDGDPHAASRRLSEIQGIAVLDIPARVAEIADALLAVKALPTTAREDALHIGVAADQGLDYLLTWNFKHINNAEKKARIREVLEDFSHACPIICSPEALGAIS